MSPEPEINAFPTRLGAGGQVEPQLVALASPITVELAEHTEVELAPGAVVALAAGTKVALEAGTTVGLAAGTKVGIEGEPTMKIAAGQSVKVAGTALVEGVVAITGEPTVHLAAGGIVHLAAGTTVGVEGEPTFKLAAGTKVAVEGEPTVHLAGGTSVNVGNEPTVKIAAGQSVTIGEPTVKIAAGQNVGITGEPTVKLPAGEEGKQVFVGGGNVQVAGKTAVGAEPGDNPVLTAVQDPKKHVQRAKGSENGSLYVAPFETVQKPWQMKTNHLGASKGTAEQAAVSEYRYVLTYLYVSLLVVEAAALALEACTFILKEGVKEIFEFQGTTNGLALGTIAVLAQMAANPLNIAELTNQKLEVEMTTVAKVKMLVNAGGYMVKG